MKLLQVTTTVLLTIIGVIGVVGQDSDDLNEDSPVLLTLTQGSDKDKFPDDAIINLNDPNPFGDISNDLSTSSVSPKLPDQPSSPIFLAVPQPTPRPSLFQAFLAGRTVAATPRPSPFVEWARNLNLSGRFANLRQRLGRFRIPRLQTNENSLAYRSGRRLGLFLQNTSKRARALAERLRARAATATPTAS